MKNSIVFAVAGLFICSSLHLSAAGSGVAQSIIREKLRVSTDLVRRWKSLRSADQRKEFLDSLRASRRSSATKESELHIEQSFNDGAVAQNDEGSEIHAAINPTDSMNLVCSGMSTDDAGQLSFPLYYSHDFGQTWSKSGYSPAPDDASSFILGGGDPMFAFDANGKLYFSWIDLYFSLSSANPPMDMYWISSTNGGVDWQRNPTNDTISSGYVDFTNQDQSPLVDKQWMVCDRSNSAGRNNLYTSLLQYFPTDQRVALRTKVANESAFRSSFARPTRSDYSFNQFTSVDCDDSGRVHMSFIAALPSDSMPLGEYRLYHLLSTDHGASFLPEVEVSRVHFLQSSPGSQTSIEAPVGMSRIQALPQLACDKYELSQYHGNVYIAWTAVGTESRATSGTDIYFSRSTDHGSTWSAPVVVNDDKSGPNTTQAYVSLTVSPKGVVVLGWYDFRDDPSNQKGRYYMCYSFDGGGSFSKNFAIASSATDFSLFDGSQTVAFGMGEYNQIVCSDNYAIPFWGDARDGIRRIYSAHVPISPNVPADGVESIQDVENGISLSAPQPNPATSSIVLHCTSHNNRKAVIQIIDLQGHTVLEMNTVALEAGQNTIELPVHNLINGSYFVELQSGNARITHKLIVQH